MIHPPFRFLIFIDAHFSERIREAENKNARRPATLGFFRAQIVSPTFGGMGARERQIYGCRFGRLVT